MPHTILTIQPGQMPHTRCFSDFNSVNDCLEAVCNIYVEHLKKLNPNSRTITYDVTELFDFIDRLADLSCFVYQRNTETYAPYNRDWIKEKIYVLLRCQAQRE